jgi:uncharacterized protein YndB with AHSA1/START domain
MHPTQIIMKNQFLAQTSILIKAPSAQVWDALTNPAIVQQYFFGTNLSAEWKVGGMIYFRGEYEGTPYEDKGIITAIETNKHLKYNYKSSWDDSADIPENYMPIEYHLTEENQQTQLTILQGSDTQEKADHSIENWQMVLQGMKELLEKNR